jgi:hypothetical protein
MFETSIYQQEKNEGVKATTQTTDVQFELEGLRNLIRFLKDENIRAKNRISDILATAHPRDVLEELEQFHNKFVRYDVVISIARNDLATFELLLSTGTADKSNILESVRKLRSGYFDIAQDYYSLLAAFGDFIIEKI